MPTLSVATYYRRRCEPKKLRLSIWDARIRLGSAVVRWIEPEDPLSDKAPAGYRVKLHWRPGGGHAFDVKIVGPDTLLEVPAGDRGLREIC